MTSLNPEPASGAEARARLDQVVESMPYAHRTGMVLSNATADGVVGSLEWSSELCTTAGLLHGGALMTFADSLGAVCAFLNLPEGAVTSTVESKTNFFRAVREGTVHGTSRPLHVGRRLIAVQTELRDDDERLVAQVTQTQAVIDASE